MSNLLSLAACVSLCWGQTADDELGLLEEAAFRRAVARIDASLVRIETIGGLDRLSGSLEAATTTTGLVVSPDGEILTSAFAFAARPSSVLVRLADGKRFPAQVVATDHVLQLTLLRIDASGLSVPEAAAPESVSVGQWALATGRALDARRPSISVGIVSALNRVWGKALQTDAKVSPVNYGGALLDIQGRVLGVLVPLSPRSDETLAGVEWYDSGIGFAIPMDRALESVRRLRKGDDLKKGLLGVSFDSKALYGREPKLDNVRYDSPADKAGLKKGDVIVSVDSKPTTRIAEVRHVLGSRYAGDEIEVVTRRSEETRTHRLKLVEKLVPWEPGFLGILPIRNDSQDGAGIRFVLPESPAAAAGLAAGHRIVQFQGEDVSGAAALRLAVGRVRPGSKATLKYQAGEKVVAAEVTIASMPRDAPVSLPPPATRPGGEEVQAATERIAETFETHQHDFWGYVPETYNPKQPPGLVVWLHPAGDAMEARILDDWKPICDSRNLVLLAPKAASPRGWNPNELPFVRDCIELMQDRYATDPSRTVVHSYGDSSQLAFALAFQHREHVRGLIVCGGGLRTPPPENRPEYPLQAYLYCGQKDPVFPVARATVNGLRSFGYPVSFAASPATAREYPLTDQIRAFGRWIDSIDRI